MENKYYIVIRTWHADKYDNGTTEVVKVFTDKGLAHTYCEERNKKTNKHIKEEYAVVEESRENDDN